MPEHHYVLAARAIEGALITVIVAMVGWITAAEVDGTIAVGAVVTGVATFGGLLATQVVKNQKFVWTIVAEKERTITQRDAEIARLTWEREQARYRAHERDDPGPFKPRTRGTQ